jgi:hypothetical protein
MQEQIINQQQQQQQPQPQMQQQGQMQSQPQMEQQQQNVEGQVMEEGGEVGNEQVQSNNEENQDRLIVHWGLIFTFFKEKIY